MTASSHKPTFRTLQNTVGFQPETRPSPYPANTETLARIADHKITRLDELMPWRYAQN
jgi:hypothetical protein